MQRLSVAAIALAGVAAIGSAEAADMPVAPLVVAPAVFSWTGPYVGGNVGYAWGFNEITAQFFTQGNTGVPIDSDAVSNAASPEIGSNGFIGGGQVGYNYQMGNIVVGLEDDFDYLDLRGSDGGTLPFPSTFPATPSRPTTFFSTATSVSTDWMFTARARLGLAVHNALFYVTGGLAVADEQFSQTIHLLSPFVINSSFSEARVGWVVGGGLEYALNRSWSIKGEYLYADLGTQTTLGAITPTIGLFNLNCAPNVGTAAPVPCPISAHLTTSIARVGINYKFDWAGPVVAKN